MYNLLELYSTMPVTKTVQRQSLTPVSNLDTGILLRPGKKSNLLNNMSILVSGASSKTPDVEQVLLTDLSGTEQQQQGNMLQICIFFCKENEGTSAQRFEQMRTTSLVISSSFFKPVIGQDIWDINI